MLPMLIYGMVQSHGQLNLTSVDM